MFHIVYGSRGSNEPTRVFSSKKAYPETRWPLMRMISEGLRPGERYIDIIGHFEGPLSPATAQRILEMRAPRSEPQVGHFPFDALDQENVVSRSNYVKSLRMGSKCDELFPAISWPEQVLALRQGLYDNETAVPQDSFFFPLTLDWLSQFGGYLYEKIGNHELLRKDSFTNPLTLSVEDCSTLLQRLNVFARPRGYFLRLPSFYMFQALLGSRLEFEDSEINAFSTIQRLMGRTTGFHYLRDALKISLVPTGSAYSEKAGWSKEPSVMSTELNPVFYLGRYRNPGFRYMDLSDLRAERVHSAREKVPNSTVILQRTEF